jgi:hypothetical protein
MANIFLPNATRHSSFVPTIPVRKSGVRIFLFQAQNMHISALNQLK